MMKKLSAKEKNVAIAAMLILVAFAIYFAYSDMLVRRMKSPYEEASTFAMGTYVTQRIYCTLDDPEQVTVDAYGKIKDLENKISWRIEGSDIYKANNNMYCIPSQETRDLVMLCLEIAEKSNGAFDPTVLPLIKLWGFDSDLQSVPEEKERKKTLELVNYKNISYNMNTSELTILKEGTQLDLGAIGKGAACDEAVKVYRTSGINGAVVAVGGSVGTFGTKPDGSLWEIGVRDPRGKSSSDMLGTLSVGECFISTSGDYEKFFVAASNYYHHILDPRTGTPANSRIISATVVSDNGAAGDAIATACVVLGRADALKLAEETGVELVLVDDDKKVYVTSGLTSSFTLTADGYTLAEF